MNKCQPRLREPKRRTLRQAREIAAAVPAVAGQQSRCCNLSAMPMHSKKAHQDPRYGKFCRKCVACNMLGTFQGHDAARMRAPCSEHVCALHPSGQGNTEVSSESTWTRKGSLCRSASSVSTCRLPRLRLMVFAEQLSGRLPASIPNNFNSASPRQPGSAATRRLHVLCAGRLERH